MPSETLTRPIRSGAAHLPRTPDTLPEDLLEDAIGRASAALGNRQRADGHWVFELEADATIPAEYVLLEHYLDRINPALQAKIGIYLRRIQGEHGGWPLFHGGTFNLSASVKAYYALKAIGDLPDTPHMARAREAILAAGGAERTNVFTRIQLALFGAGAVAGDPGHAGRDHAPAPVVLRSICQQGVVLVAHGPGAAAGADGAAARGRATRAASSITGAVPHAARGGARLDPRPLSQRLGPLCSKRSTPWCGSAEPAIPHQAVGTRAIDQAVAFVTRAAERRGRAGRDLPGNGQQRDDVRRAGLRAPTIPDAAIAWASRAQADGGDGGRSLLPALPVADLGHEPGRARRGRGRKAPRPRPVDAACAWLVDRQQITEVRGDWAVSRPDAPPGGWAFQYENPHYPDVDDTAVVGHAAAPQRQTPRMPAAIANRARDWVLAMQSSQRRLGRVRRRQRRIELPEPYPVRRPRRPARSAPTADVTARCVGPSWRSWAMDGGRSRRWRGRSTTCGASRSPMAAGSAGGARTTSTAPGRYCAR